MYYFIVNPKSKSKRGKELWSVIAHILRDEAVSYKVFFTKYRGHGTKLARSITQKDPACTLVAVGGDGTIHEVLSGITNYETITFGYIPSGSGNDFARGMRIKSDTALALRAILHPSAYMNMDLGHVSRGKEIQRFGVSCGIGFDASICHEALASPLKTLLNKIHLGKLTYALLAAKQILLYEPCQFTLEFNGQRTYTFGKTYFVAAFNQNVEGGGLKLVPHASPDDRSLDVIVVEGMSRAKIFFLLPLAFAGLHTHLKGVHFIRCKKVSIRCSRKVPIHLDGESGGIHKDLCISMEPKGLRVITG